MFGCTCWVHVPKTKRKKFDSKSEKAIFVEYSESSKVYRVYYPEKKLLKISHDVTFFENQCYEEVVSPNSDLSNYFDLSTVIPDLVGNDGTTEVPDEVTQCDVMANVSSGGEADEVIHDESANDSKTKKDTSGKTVRYKARLVIKGCAQKNGIDY